jgi:hypothetical protein
MVCTGLIFVGPVVDLLRSHVAHPYRWAAMLSMCCGFVTALLAWQLDLPSRRPSAAPAEAQPAAEVPLVADVEVATSSEVQHAVAAISSEEKSQRRRGYCLLVALLVGVRALFRHLDATWPKFFLRTFGPSAPFGTVYALEPFLIITLVPLLSGDSRAGAGVEGNRAQHLPLLLHSCAHELV